jgi:hypothetical protein
VPQTATAIFDHDKALTGDDLIKHVDENLFRYEYCCDGRRPPSSMVAA